MYRLIMVIVCICLLISACDSNTSPQKTVPDPQISPQSGIYLSAQHVTIE